MTINYVILEENLNNLLFEKKIHNLRTALPNYILDRLRERVQIKMTDVGITSDAEALFLDAQNALDATFLKRLQDSLNLLGLSKNSIDYITKIAKRSRQAALDELKDKLLKAERIQFWKDAGISANKWKPFYECTEYTDQKTLDKIKQQLKLTDDQQKEFDRRVIARVFYVSGELRELVYDLLGKTGKKVEDFKIYAFIGKDAWESFYLAKDGKDKQAKTSQKTLLKLVVGFGLGEPKAWDFMGVAKSAFVMRQDLVVLACIRCRYTDPMEVMEILDYFAEGENGEVLYSNIYN